MSGSYDEIWTLEHGFSGTLVVDKNLLLVDEWSGLKFRFLGANLKIPQSKTSSGNRALTPYQRQALLSHTSETEELPTSLERQRGVQRCVSLCSCTSAEIYSRSVISATFPAPLSSFIVTGLQLLNMPLEPVVLLD